MSDLRTAAAMALETLEWRDETMRTQADSEAIDALRAALARPDEQEPDESVIFYRCKGCAFAYESDCPTSCDCMSEAGFLKVKYFTHPPQRKPLTQERIWAAYQKQSQFHPAAEPRLASDLVKFARAIERAHGIGGEE
jgi:hypothetical protein